MQSRYVSLHRNLLIQNCSRFILLPLAYYSLRIIYSVLVVLPFSGYVTPDSTMQNAWGGKINNLPRGNYTEYKVGGLQSTPSQDKHPVFHWREILEADSASRLGSWRTLGSITQELYFTSGRRGSVNILRIRRALALLFFLLWFSLITISEG